MPIKFQNFLAASRKPNLKPFSFVHPSADLTWIESYPVPPTSVNLTSSIEEGVLTYALGLTNPVEVEVIFNGITLLEDVGYTLDSANGTITMQTGYEPVSGDTLVAKVLGGQ